MGPGRDTDIFWKQNSLECFSGFDRDIYGLCADLVIVYIIIYTIAQNNYCKDSLNFLMMSYSFLDRFSERIINRI